MSIYEVIIYDLLICAVILVVLFRAVRRNRLRTEADLKSLDQSLKVEVAIAWAEVAEAKLDSPATLLVSLDLSDEETLPDLPTATQEAQPLVSALSQQEKSLGGLGLMLTAAKVERGSVRLTLSPIERSGSAARVRRVAEEMNAALSPLPPGVTAAHADILAV